MKKLILTMACVFMLTGCQAGNEKANENKENVTNDKQVETQKVNVESSDDQNTQSPEVAEVAEVSDDNSGIAIHAEEAINIFLEKYPEAKIDELSFEKEGSTFYHKIEGYDGSSEYELVIDAKDGSIIKEEVDGDDDDDDNEALNLDLVKDIQSLIDMALADAGSDYYFKSYDVDYDDGINKLEVELKKESGEDLEYKYNLETKELIEKDS